jgi:hypothetical protein
MKPIQHNSPKQLIAMEPEGDKRQKPRLDGQLGLTFSGMDAADMFFDTGIVTDLCQDGIGACSERSLKPGIPRIIFAFRKLAWSGRAGTASVSPSKS